MKRKLTLAVALAAATLGFVGQNLCLCQVLTYDRNGAVSVSGVPPTAVVQLYASADLRTWSWKQEFAAAQVAVQPPTNNVEFLRARVKPAPAVITVESPLVVTGSLYRVTGKTDKVLTGLTLLNSESEWPGRITSQEIGLVEGKARLKYAVWGFPSVNLKPGSNFFTAQFVDIDRNQIVTNLAIISLPGGVPLTVEHPQNGVQVIGSSVTVIGQVEDLDSKVWVETGTERHQANVMADGKFYAVNIPCAPTNRWTVVSSVGSQSHAVNVSFVQSPVQVTYTTRSVKWPSSSKKFTVDGQISDTNYCLKINGTTILPDGLGRWQYRGDFPVKGVLPFTVEPRVPAAPAGAKPFARSASQPPPSGGAILYSGGADWMVTSHSVSDLYEYKAIDDPKLRSSKYSGGFGASQTAHLTVVKKFWHGSPFECQVWYTNVFNDDDLWMEQTDFEGECRWNEFKVWGPWAETADYESTGGEPWFDWDHLVRSAGSSCVLYTGGTAGGNRLYRYFIYVWPAQVTDRAGDEVFFEMTSGSVIGAIGSSGAGVSGGAAVVTEYAEENSYLDITPTISTFTKGWFEIMVSIVQQEIDPPSS